MPVYYPQEVHQATDGQTVVSLETPYLVGSNELSVFLNGMISILGDDYNEVDESTIEFTYQLSDSDVIVIQRKVSTEGIHYTVIGQDDSLFKTLGTEKTLMPNQTYTLTFEQAGQTFTSTFQTLIDLLYSSVKIVRNDMGEVISTVPDNRILFLIYQNSILSQNIASEDNLALLEDEEKTPYVFKQFVRYRTEYDLMNAVFLYNSGNSGEHRKTLGEFEITRRTELGRDFSKALDDLKAKLRKWERLLTGASTTSPVLSTVKGGTSNPYPLTTPRMTNRPNMTTGG